MGEVLVRTALPADYPAIGALSVDAFRADGQLEAGESYADTLADVATRAAESLVLCAVDSESGGVLGAVTYVLSGSRYAGLASAGEAEFRMLAVAPHAQRRGVGEALARACVERAQADGCSAVVISVRDFSHHAQRLYARLDFRRTPDRDWSPVEGVLLLALRLDLPVAADH